MSSHSLIGIHLSVSWLFVALSTTFHNIRMAVYYLCPLWSHSSIFIHIYSFRMASLSSLQMQTQNFFFKSEERYALPASL